MLVPELRVRKRHKAYHLFTRHQTKGGKKASGILRIAWSQLYQIGRIDELVRVAYDDAADDSLRFLLFPLLLFLYARGVLVREGFLDHSGLSVIDQQAGMCVMVELTELMELYQSDVHFHSRDRHKDLYSVENLTCSDQLKNQELERRQKLEKKK